MGKLLGAGGGGFIVLLAVEEENQTRVKEALKDYLHIPFRVRLHRFGDYSLQA